MTIEHTSFAISVLFFSFLFTPIIEPFGWTYYVIPIASSLFLGIGLHLKRQRENEAQVEYKTMLLKEAEQQEKQVQILENQLQQQSEAIGSGFDKLIQHLLASQQSVSQTISQTISETIRQTIQHSMETLMEAKQREESQRSQWTERIIVQLKEQHKQQGDWSQEIAAQLTKSLEQNGNELKDIHSSLLAGIMRITDSITDLERKMEWNVGRLIDTVTDGHAIQEDFQDKLEEIFEKWVRQYEEFNNNIASYQMKVKHVSEDIEEYRDHIEKDLQERLDILQNLVDTLSEATTQLADSKHHEREQALQVQRKLSEQFERLVKR